MPSSSKPHLVFVNYYFPPMGGGGVQRVVKFLKYADSSRYRITVLTVRPSFFYSKDDTLAAEIPPEVQVIHSGSLDPFRLMYLFRRLLQRLGISRQQEQPEARESSGWLRRLAAVVFVPDSRVLWMPFAILKLRRLHRNTPIDLLVGSMPPFTTGLICRHANSWLGIPYILDYRDGWTNNPYLPSAHTWNRLISERMERRCIRQSKAVLFVNPYLQQYYRQSYPLLRHLPTATIRNGFDEEDFRDLSPAPSAGGLFRLCIMGTVYSQGNRPLTLLQALSRLHRADPSFANRFRLVFIGKWAPEFRHSAECKSLQAFIEWHSYLPHREALQQASGCNALALCVESVLAGSAEVTPGRIYEYLRLRRPVLAMCPLRSDLADLVHAAAAGEVCDYRDVTSIAAVLADWVGNPLPEGRYQFGGLSAFSRREQAAELLTFVDSVLQRNAKAQ